MKIRKHQLSKVFSAVLTQQVMAATKKAVAGTIWFLDRLGLERLPPLFHLSKFLQR